MKNLLLTIAAVMYCMIVFSQGNTRVTINIIQDDTTKLSAKMYITDPTKTIGSGRYSDTLEIKNGQVKFLFNLQNPSLLTVFINDKYITFPGEYYVLIEPGDDLTFKIPSFKEVGFFGWGLPNIEISGKGSEKINLTKNMINKCFELYAKEPNYSEQSITYKFESTDRKLSIIDSIYRSNKVVPKNIKDLIKAQLYTSLLVPLLRSAKRSDTDSISRLFKKYIEDKKRAEIYYKRGVAEYGNIIPSYLILKEFKNPSKVGGDDFEKKYRIQYAKILVKRLNKNPEIRDYLLSRHLIGSIRSGFDSTTVTLYKLYCEEADFNNPNFKIVTDLFESTEKKMTVGKPFYNFSLPDSVGKVHKLNDFIGKVIVIDFWYNGCGGCRLMVPALEKIENEMRGKEVQFISIGIDKRDLWLEGIGKYSSSGSLQLYTEGKSKEHPMMKYLNIYAYPRLIVVDKNGNIAGTPPEPRLQNKEFVRYIESLL